MTDPEYESLESVLTAPPEAEETAEIAETEATEETGDTEETEVEAKAETDESTEETEEAEAKAEAEEEDSPPESNEIATLKGQVDGLKAAIAALRSDKRELKEQLEKEQEEKQPVSVLEDEDAAFAERDSKLEEKYLRREFERSKRQAIKAHGEELVEQATDWFNEVGPKTPALQQRFWESLNDVDEVVTMFKENQQMAELKDVDKVRAQMREELLSDEDFIKELLEKAEAKAPPKKKPATPSLADKTSRRLGKEGEVPDDLGSILDGVGSL